MTRQFTYPTNQLKFWVVILLLFSISLTSCKNHFEIKELYKMVDGFIENMEYKSYSVSPANAQLTKSGEYRVAPMGKIIIVKIERYAPEDEYEKLKRKLARRYKKNKTVRDVYINQSGTIVIDCR